MAVRGHLYSPERGGNHRHLLRYRGSLRVQLLGQPTTSVSRIQVVDSKNIFTTPKDDLDSGLNPAAFAIPALSTGGLGNGPPVLFWGPGSWNFDMSLFKKFFLSKDGETWYKDGALLQDKGYSYDFLALANLKLPNAVVTSGRLAASGPAYKALILNPSLDTSNNAVVPEDRRIGLDAAKKILELAKDGLTVIYFGETPVKATFICWLIPNWVSPLSKPKNAQKKRSFLPWQ
ncbi:MAG: secreted protein [Acidobacteria bacterium]|nr:secreted protein [Acidobacteriota bacterium]